MYSHPFDEGTGVPLLFGGHCFYTRKRITGTQVGANFWDREINGVAIPQASADNSQFVDIVAVGPNVGKQCSKMHSRMYERRRHLPSIVKPGDMILCPNDSIGIQRSTLLDEHGNRMMYEHFIEESIPMAVARPDAPHGFLPLGDRCLVEMIVDEESDGILYVDPELKAKRAKVLSVGNGSLYLDGTPRKFEFECGSEVLIRMNAGIPVSFDLNQSNLRICNSKEILALVSDGENKEAA